MKSIETTFAKAIETMNPGDSFSPNSSMYSEFIMNVNGTFRVGGCDISKELPLSKGTLLLIGVIIPAEPKVLTADEYWKTAGYYSEIVLKSTHDKIFNAGHKNGRLERDLELRNVISLIKKYLNGMENFYSAETMEALHEDLIEAVFKTLKPLNNP